MSSDNWKKVKLGDVCNIRRGSSPRPIKDYLSDAGMPWVKIADATESNSRFIEKTNEYIKLNGVAKSVIVEPGSLILSNSGTAGLPKFMHIKACIHDGWQVFENCNGIDKDFLYYCLLFIRERLLHGAYDSTMKNLTLDMVRDAIIDLPPLEEQKIIAENLSCIDEKIELNNQINNNLEDIAQSIFRSWFVDFEPFQDREFEQSELGSIPKGWRVDSLDNIANYLNGIAMQKYRPETEESLPVIKIKELNQGYTDENSDRASVNIPEQYIIQNGDVVFSWSGTLAVKIWTGGIGGLNQHLFKVTSDYFNKWFYYLWTLNHLEKFKAIAQDKATTMGHIKRGHLTESKVLVPTDTDLVYMNNIMNPIIHQMIANRIQNEALKELRDSLLPKLMSGELRVPLQEAMNA